jgi:parallel beta-helix repeat protein
MAGRKACGVAQRVERRAGWTRALLFGCVLVTAGAPAAANGVCGAIITGDLRLDHDVVCAADGIVIGADGIRIDLNGHTLAGSGAGVGILVTGRTDVTIAGGAVRNFAAAVRLNNSTGIVIRQNEFTDNAEALDLQAGAIGNTVKENVFRDSTMRAIMLRGNSRDNDVKNNTFIANRIAILVFGGVENEIKDNLIAENSVAGIRLNVIATGNVIKSNTIAASAVGVDILVTPTGSATGNELKGNTLAGNGCGLNGPTTGNTVKDNLFEANVADVCPAP